ncbi:coiled-coil domain-containing protein 27 isoform X3 [Malaclemys terrapin pileata]|uniref:coiled-coil domain-containing protein 27 isoform X3 n=1 Tax=Malaclemys terrapin pileata TaxID=2991368 RepID=UPI0023A8ADD6|nr:coiled-coil domain-containing protein 27 isoform X3 [Malaclemys terrapin pileata]
MNLMTKGFSELQELSSRRQQTPVWKLPSGRSTLSKSAQAVRRYYENQADIKPAGVSASEYEPQVEELQRSFLMRPGCPRFSNRATSTSYLESTLSHSPDLSFNLSTISLSSQLNFEEWNAAFQNTYPSESATKAAGHLLLSKSFSGLSKWKSFTEGIVPAEQQKGPIESKIPWYIDVIREKERCLLMMGEKINRLSRCEAECARKDDVISILREEIENLKKHLELLRRESVITEEKDAASEPVADDSKTKIPGLSSSVQEGLGQSGTKEDLREEYSEMQQKGLRQEDMEKELLGGTEIEVASEEEEENEAEAEEKASLIKLREFQQVNQELCKELEKAKTDYDMATGAITSLQRQLAFQESQLRRAESEKEMLQKELRERGSQLQAMSAKFSSLREERKREEMMGIIERENYKLRQDIVEQESRLAEKNKLIDDLQSKINQLQAEVMVAQHHMQKQLCDQSETQSQVEALKHAEQQAKVALECISARFERFRSKIIQATYSAAGAKSPQAEISDEEALEAMQRIISERLDYHQMLKQKGVKVPSLFSSEPANLSSPNSKTTKKSPVK